MQLSADSKVEQEVELPHELSESKQRRLWCCHLLTVPVNRNNGENVLQSGRHPLQKQPQLRTQMSYRLG